MSKSIRENMWKKAPLVIVFEPARHMSLKKDFCLGLPWVFYG